MPVDDLRYFKKLSGETTLQTLESSIWADVPTVNEEPEQPPTDEWVFLAWEKANGDPNGLRQTALLHK